MSVSVSGIRLDKVYTLTAGHIIYNPDNTPGIESNICSIVHIDTPANANQGDVAHKRLGFKMAVLRHIVSFNEAGGVQIPDVALIKTGDSSTTEIIPSIPLRKTSVKEGESDNFINYQPTADHKIWTQDPVQVDTVYSEPAIFGGKFLTTNEKIG